MTSSPADSPASGPRLDDPRPYQVPQDWLIVVNANAGRGLAPLAANALQATSPDSFIRYTTHRNPGRRLQEIAAAIAAKHPSPEAPLGILVMGGDGTVNDAITAVLYYLFGDDEKSSDAQVAERLLQSGIFVGAIKGGSLNDIARLAGAPGTDVADVVNYLKNARPAPISMGMADFADGHLAKLFVHSVTGGRLSGRMFRDSQGVGGIKLFLKRTWLSLRNIFTATNAKIQITQNGKIETTEAADMMALAIPMVSGFFGVPGIPRGGLAIKLLRFRSSWQKYAFIAEAFWRKVATSLGWTKFVDPQSTFRFLEPADQLTLRPGETVDIQVLDGEEPWQANGDFLTTAALVTIGALPPFPNFLVMGGSLLAERGKEDEAASPESPAMPVPQAKGSAHSFITSLAIVTSAASPAAGQLEPKPPEVAAELFTAENSPQKQLITRIAEILGSNFATVAEQVLIETEHLWKPAEMRLVEAALAILGRDLRANPPKNARDEKIIRDGINYLRFAGFAWTQLHDLVPDSMLFYLPRTNPLKKQGDHEAGFGYPWVHNGHPPVTSDFGFRQAMEFAPGQIVLDPLAGYGKQITPLAAVFPDTTFVALELNPDNLQVCKNMMGEYTRLYQNLWLVPHDSTTQFPLEDNQVDRVLLNSWATYGMLDLELTAFFAQTLRTLRHEGRIWMDFLGYEFRSENFARDIAALKQTAQDMGIALTSIAIDEPTYPKNTVHAFRVIKPVTIRTGTVGSGSKFVSGSDAAVCEAPSLGGSPAIHEPFSAVPQVAAPEVVANASDATAGDLTDAFALDPALPGNTRSSLAMGAAKPALLRSARAFVL